MIQSYGVGRASLREALRLLEGQGLVRIKAGPGGGPVVGRASPRNLSRVLTLFMRLVGVTYEDLMDGMLVVVPMLTGMAARRELSGEMTQALEAAIHQSEISEDYRQTVDGMKEFHELLIDASGNKTLSFVANALMVIFTDHLLASIDTRPFHATARHDHAEIIKAVLRRRPNAAQNLMQEHIERKILFVKEQMPGMFSQLIEWR